MIVGLAVVVYLSIEGSAVTRWSEWAFRGIRVFRRRADYGISTMTVSEIGDFILTDSEIKSKGLIFEKVGDSRFLIRFLGKPSRFRLLRGNGRFIIGELKFDSDRRVMKLTFSVIPSLFAFLMLPVIGSVWQTLAAGKYLAAIWPPLFFVTFYVVVFRILIRPSLVGFWFLLTTKLRTE